MVSEAEQIVGIYRRHAATWVSDRLAGTFVEIGWLEKFRLLLPDGGAILDIGCGAGRPIASHFMKQGYAVFGVDSSPEMIAMCENSFPEREWRVADMRSLKLERTFDGLLAWDSFFHLAHDDQRRMFAVFDRHAAPGAALMFTSGTSHGEAIGSLKGDPLYHASLDAEEYRALLRAHGFEIVANAFEDKSCGGRTVWLAKSVR